MLTPSEKQSLKSLADQFLKIRLSLQLSQRKVYSDTGINIARIESGTDNITFTTLLQLCTYYRIVSLQFNNQSFSLCMQNIVPLTMNSENQQINSTGSVQNGNVSVQNGNGSVQNSNGRIQNASGSLQNSNGSLQNSNGSLQNVNGSVQNANGSVQNSNGSVQNSTDIFQKIRHRLQNSISSIPTSNIKH